MLNQPGRDSGRDQLGVGRGDEGGEHAPRPVLPSKRGALLDLDVLGTTAPAARHSQPPAVTATPFGVRRTSQVGSLAPAARAQKPIKVPVVPLTVPVAQ